MTTREDLGIQCAEISSTSDVFHCPYQTRHPLGGRSSYRKSFRRLHLPNISNYELRNTLNRVQRTTLQYHPLPVVCMYFLNS